MNHNLLKKQIFQKKSIAKKRMIRSLTFIILAIAILGIIYFFIHLVSPSSEVNLVKNIVLESYESQTLGNALNNFFYEPNWASSDKNIVEFTGVAYWGEDESIFTLKFTFDVEQDLFDITSYTINQESQTYDELILLLDTIYEKE